MKKQIRHSAGEWKLSWEEWTRAFLPGEDRAVDRTANKCSEHAIDSLFQLSSLSLYLRLPQMPFFSPCLSEMSGNIGKCETVKIMPCYSCGLSHVSLENTKQFQQRPIILCTLFSCIQTREKCYDIALVCSNKKIFTTKNNFLGTWAPSLVGCCQNCQFC